MSLVNLAVISNFINFADASKAVRPCHIGTQISEYLLPKVNQAT